MDKRTVIKDLVVFLLELSIGIVFLIAPDTMTKGMIILLGVIAIILGLRDLFTYCSESAQDAAAGSSLVSAIAFILIGLLCTIGYERVYAVVFGSISFIFGALLMVFGLTKFQRTIDCLRLHISRWWINAIVAATTITFAAIILWNPFETIKTVFIFIGISFIVEAAFTLAGMLILLFLQHADKKAAKINVTVVDNVESQSNEALQDGQDSTELTTNSEQ